VNVIGKKTFDNLPLNCTPFPPLDNIRAMMIVWKIRGENHQNCSVLYCVTQLCTVICTL